MFSRAQKKGGFVLKKKCLNMFRAQKNLLKDMKKNIALN